MSWDIATHPIDVTFLGRPTRGKKAPKIGRKRGTEIAFRRPERG